MMRILFISPTNTLDNGAEISIFHLMALLVKRGDVVYNVTQQGTAEGRQLHQKRYEEIGVTTYYLNSLKWWWQDAPGGLPASSSDLAASYRDNISQLQEIIRKESIQLVVTNTVNVFQGAVAAALSGLPHYWLIHEFPEREFAYYKDKCDFISDFSDELFTVAGSLEEELTRHFPNRQLRTFIPFSQMLDTPLSPGQTKRFVSIGRLNKRKNQLELIKAYQQLRQTLADCPELVFIGGADEDYRKEITRYMKQHAIKGISFLGHVDQPWDLVTDQDIAVFPSAMETFGMVYVESLWRGLPTIASDNLGHQTAYQLFQAGHLYPVGDVDQLAQEMLDKVTHHDQYVKEAQLAKEKVKASYQADTVYAAFLTLLDQENLTTVPKSLRHLEGLLTLNQSSTRLVRAAIKLSWFLQKVKQKLGF